ncbi:MAG: S-methyl-5'-thioinosine phosphorylase, partial [Gammaproteobacteria bacterium]|nr:S-methyl-5'-thioinosine phosphorylase [Gammaproteobacteria bacterium]
EPSGPVTHGTLFGKKVAFLPRHGYGHTIPPHKVNYRANIWALKDIGARRIVAVAAVGGIHPDFVPGALAIPAQIIDYTFGRGHTFFEDGLSHVVHVDFTVPYAAELRQTLIRAAAEAGIDTWNAGIYGATQGPRLETAAEIDRLERDGCDMVGMTGMPEAALARELELDYVHLCVCANAAAGRGEGEISMADLEANLEGGMRSVKQVLEKLLSLL